MKPTDSVVQKASVAEPDRPPMHLIVQSVSDRSQAVALAAEIDALAAHVLERNPSYEGWMLAPTLRHLGTGSDIRVVTIHATDAPAGEGLRAVFVVEVVTRGRVLPVLTLRLWDRMYSLSAAPLLHADCAIDCLRAFFRWVAEAWPARTLVEFPSLFTDGAVFGALRDYLREDRVEYTIADLYSRGLFRPRADADAYLATIGNKHSRREWQRQERRLGELGELRYEVLAPDDDAAAWVDEFVALELGGWKGRGGSAFGCNPAHRAWLAEVAVAAQRRGELMALALRLDGAPVAMKLNFTCPPGGYTFKIAYDERYAKYTPGTLLEFENVRQLHRRPEIAWMDSLAKSDHGMINRIWHDRATYATVRAAPRRLAAEAIIASVPLLRLASRRWRSTR
jgi:CelD/BcsL family acetyltransferase involved in cellulose biosynthesis